ncbi:MAG: serine/threonine-protein phosphatase [Treponema sp.]|nr:serine/threonine-protein phosphatase [Treponema sp.]
MKFRFFFLCLFISMGFLSCADEIKPRIQLGEIMKISEDKTTNDNEKYIYINASFELPEELKNKDLALFSSYIKSADKVWINGTYIGSSGKFPPHPFGNGVRAHYYFIPKAALNQNKENKLLIKVWVSNYKMISSDMFIGEVEDALKKYAYKTFYTSKVNMFFSGLMFVVFLIYWTMFFSLKKSTKCNDYMIFALLNIHTLMFNVPFYAMELPTISALNVSYLWFLKIFFCYGAMGAVYFANSFIIHFMKYDVSRKTYHLRYGITSLCTLFVFCAPSMKALTFIGPIAFLINLSHFAITIPYLYKGLKDPERFHNARKILKGFAPVIVSIFFDLMLRLIVRQKNLPFFTVYGWQITILVFLQYILTEYNRMYLKNTELTNRLSEFNENLEEIVAIRTKELQDTNYVLSKGIEAVSNVQNNFLPQKTSQFIGWDLAVTYTPISDNVSGDLYDYYTNNHRLEGMGIFDVSGHGITAGLMTILAKGIISQNFETGLEQNASLNDVMHNINETYIKEKLNVENYITGLLFRFGTINKKEECTVECVNAGHPYPLLYSAKTKKITEIKPSVANEQYGMIGIEGLNVSFSPTVFKMNKNDILICFTDGITETKNERNMEFGTNKIKKIVCDNADLSSHKILEKIEKSFRNFSDIDHLKDDTTLIVLKRNNSKDYIEEL